MSQAKLPTDNAWEAFEKTSGKLRDAYKMERSKNCWIIRKFDKNSHFTTQKSHLLPNCIRRL